MAGHDEKNRCPVWGERTVVRSTRTKQFRCSLPRGHSREQQHENKGTAFGGPRSIRIINETKETS